MKISLLHSYLYSINNDLNNIFNDLIAMNDIFVKFHYER